MTHFTDPELLRWSEHGPGADRDRVVAHVAECGACAARYAAAIRTRPLAAEDAHVMVPPSRRSVWWIAAPLAAAAMIVLAVFVARGTVQQSPPTRVFRGGTLHTVAPDGETTTSSAFEWASSAEAARYKVTVGGPSGPIYTFIARSSPAPFPDALRPLLAPATDYWWTVTALDNEGHMFLLSERRAFRIRTR